MTESINALINVAKHPHLNELGALAYCEQCLSESKIDYVVLVELLAGSKSYEDISFICEKCTFSFDFIDEYIERLDVWIDQHKKAN